MRSLASLGVDADKELVRRGGLRTFVELAWPHVDPAPFVSNWHIDEMCTHLEQVSIGEIRDLVINIPPGHSKSLVVSVLWPAWDWTHCPSRKWMCASYEDSLAERDAKRMRDLVTSRWYQQRWGADVQLAHEDDRKVELFSNRKGGFRYSQGAGSGFTGRHADIQICDDPHAVKEVIGPLAHVQAALEKRRDWWTITMPTRATKPSELRRVLVM